MTANDEDLAERIRMLAFHGSRDKTTFDFVGYNSRLDELQAAFLRVFLEHLDEWTRGRREAAARYAELGLGDLVELPEDEPGHVYHLIVSRSRERDRIREALSAADIARDVLRHAAAPSPRFASSATSRARCPKPSAPPQRTSRCRSGRASRRRSRSAWSRPSVRPSA